MLSYVPIGLACGVLSAKVGIGPLWALLMSMTIMSGGAQFMIANLWLAGLPTLTIVASVCAISLRFALYSASLAAVAGVAVALAATRGEALGYIPPAAFAALVANDLFSPGAFAAGPWPALLPMAAAAVVVIVAKKTRSMLWCCIAGVVAYVALGALPL